MVYDRILKLSGLFEKLAFNTIKAVLNKIRLPLLTVSHGKFICIIPLAEKNNMLIPVGQISLDEPNIKLNPGFNKNEWMRIATIQADDPWVAIYLLGAALYLGKRVIGDSLMSEAALAVMKRTYNKNKDSGLIIDNVVAETPSLKDQPWKLAGYLNDGKNDAEYAEAFAAGKEIEIRLSEEDIDKLLQILQSRWNLWVSS